MLFRRPESLWKFMLKCARFSCHLTAVLAISIQSDLRKGSSQDFPFNINGIPHEVIRKL